ncbi:competence protein ComK [Bacillus sp. 31A1R]|uniref:Competence protein ComK n=1 Tax=Robertmurraya mangrovi TaxID=3098077 RepID=A0ABU5ISX7_9BACI|nr:competence protein ComK [Bacillus sp. 31A1R]MDZ5470239.1 competence protein ComK [Bacillus sp. 31A1R]
MEKKIIEEYEINSSTLIIFPLKYGSKVYSKIIELEEEFISPFRPIDIIKKSCIFFGCSYEGRKEGTRQLIGITHKVPISISPTNFIYFFPTTSPENIQCIWIAHEHIIDFKKGSKDTTNVTFINKACVEVPISYTSFQNQYLRTVLLRSKLSQRLEETTWEFYTKRQKASEEKSNYLTAGNRKWHERSGSI